MKILSILLTGVISINVLFAAKKESIKKGKQVYLNDSKSNQIEEDTDFTKNTKPKFMEDILFFNKRRKQQF